ncbi:MAG: TonB-dependent receptor [Novosphingobium lindaniclasticum]|jgi:iron complex outermembrane receptor protein|uniref:TonB-dependent receptor n=1 Tax=Novosphingobium lindaniclasticum TaxID=1329895 RepID=UPI002409855A|nr:TonB-dependent receptor [Novosphingobium lindaniclasticum]MDF2640690.1 TonB-dependent receptor [Novosphingobium lindaniclasticum]
MTHRSHRQRAFACITPLSLAAALIAMPVQAQEEPGGEIVVTARQRAENVQQVPDAVSVFSAAAIRDAGIRSIDDVTTLVPNLSLVDAQDAGTVAINIRGIGQVRNGEAPVALVVDGVQMTSTDSIKQALFDLDQIEVLKGPQGALYGRNAIGGAINIVTRKPTNELEGKVVLDYANGDDRRLFGSLSGALVPDLLLFRVAADYRKFDGVLHNVTLKRKVDFVEDTNVRGRLLLTPTDRLTFDLKGAYGHLDGGASWYIPLADGHPNDTRTPIQNDFLGKSPRRITDVSLKADYRFDAFTLTSVTAINRTKIDLIEDLDWTPLSILGATQLREYESFSQEIRLASPSAQALRWTAGAYLLDARRRIDTVVLLSPDPTAIGLPPQDYLELPSARSTEDILTKAVYGQLNYDLTDQFELTLALRYDHDKRTQTNRLMPGPQREATFDEWQPKASIKYAMTPDHMVYATAARGFRSGGFNPPTGSFPELYRPEVADTLELGSKNTLLGNALTLNAAAFYMRYKDQQVFLLNVADQGIVNIAKTDIYGIEVEAQAKPTRLVQFGAALGWIDATIKDFDGTETYKGNRVPLTYRWSYTLYAQGSLELGSARLTGRVDYSGKSGNYWHIDNADRQDRVDLVNARLTYDAGAWSLAAYASNLFNAKYTEEFFGREFSAGANDIRYPGQPRRYGVTASYSF